MASTRTRMWNSGTGRSAASHRTRPVRTGRIRREQRKLAAAPDSQRQVTPDSSCAHRTLSVLCHRNRPVRTGLAPDSNLYEY